MDDFAKKLAAGLVSVPSRLSWWPRHSRMMVRYLFVGDKTSNSQDNVHQSVAMSCAEWEGAIPMSARKGLMKHHSAMELSLVDAAKAGNSGKIEKLGSLLIENAAELSASFGRSIVEFPEHKFHMLLGEHVSSYAEIVRLKMEGILKKSGERMERNTIALAAFTTEWF